MSLAQSYLFCFNHKGFKANNSFALIKVTWSFYAPETGNASGTNKICLSSKDEAREGLRMLTVPRADTGCAIR